jgi:nucleoid DNA-binding protein
MEIQRQTRWSAEEIDKFFALLAQTMAAIIHSGQEVYLQGVGSFKKIYEPAQKRTSRSTGKEMKGLAKWRVRFIPEEYDYRLARKYDMRRSTSERP